MLAALLTLGIAAFVALGVEDTRYHKSLQPNRYEASPMVVRWDDCLPGKPVLPWNTSTAK